MRTPYDYVERDSSIERAVAQRLDEADSKVYLIRETKSTHDGDKRRLEENLKIKCGKAHFAALDGVDYDVATSVEEVLNAR